MKLSKLTIGFAVLIVLSAGFMRAVLNFIYKTFGRDNLQIFMVIIFIFIGILFIVYLLKTDIPRTRVFVIVTLLLTGLIASQFMGIIEERIHILEYGLLGWLATGDAFSEGVYSDKKKNVKNFVLCIGFVFFVGVIDEVYQWILPSRVGDIRDVLFNAAGGLWGVILRILKS